MLTATVVVGIFTFMSRVNFNSVNPEKNDKLTWLNRRVLEKNFYSKFDQDQILIFVCKMSCLSDTQNFIINM